MDNNEQDDAARMRWLLDGHGYFMEENGLCGPWDPEEEDKDYARQRIDAAMDDVHLITNRMKIDRAEELLSSIWPIDCADEVRRLVGEALSVLRS